MKPENVERRPRNADTGPKNAALKISMKTLGSIARAEPQMPREAGPNVQDNSIQIKRVINNLPYSCIVEIIPPENIDRIYYAALDSKGTRLLYIWEHPTDIIPSFSIHDLNTLEDEVRFVCWTEKDGEIGSPTYFGPIKLKPELNLGTYDLEVDFEKPADIKLFEQVLPLIEKHFGKAAIPGKLKVIENSHDVYLPSKNIIKLSENRNNIIHELIHASRKQLLFANKKFQFNEETEIIEEFFAEGLSNMIKDELNLQPNDFLLDGAVYGSTIGYNYDYRIKDRALISQNLQSSWGGILTLENSRYFLASEAFHKFALEYFIKTGRYFAKDFNEIYFERVKNTLEDPNKEMFFSICESLIPFIESTPTRDWLATQLLFNTEIEEGVKLFMHINDYYTSREWLGITSINLYQTFSNGSDWVNGNERYGMNGETVKIELIHLATGQVTYQEDHQIPDYDQGFGAIKLYFHHIEDSQDVKFFMKQDKERKLNSTPIKVDSGLYEIRLTANGIVKSYYRIMGEIMWENKDKIMVANPFLSGQGAKLSMIHFNKKGEKTLVAHEEFSDLICTMDVPFIENKNCEPGLLFLRVNSGGLKQNFQRNIGYGGDYGGHQFLIGAETADFLPV